MELDTEQQIRDYVEAELDRSIRANHPSLKVSYEQSEYPARNRDRSIRWDIIREGEWDEFYTVEACFGSKEFLIWYGNITHGPWEPHFSFSQAVHLEFTAVIGNPPYDELPSFYRDSLRLGTVLEVMLERPEYPMNCLALT